MKERKVVNFRLLIKCVDLYFRDIYENLNSPESGFSDTNVSPLMTLNRGSA
jgi:hypothetical protein